MSAEAVGGVGEIAFPAISATRPVISVGLRLLPVEAYSALHAPAVGRVSLQGIDT